jgi:predicted MFS family arabinose efflux permease
MKFVRVIWPLAAAAFASGTQTYVFAGMLADIAGDLGVSIGLAGQLATAFAATFAVAAPAAAGAVGRFERRRVLWLALAAIAAINAASAFAPGYAGLLALRIAAGLAATCVVPIAAATAVALVPPEMRGRGLALVTGGTTVAFMLGIPVGSAIGGFWGWRATFVFAALLAAFAAVVVRLGVPKTPPRQGPPVALAKLARAPEAVSAFAATFLGFMAMFSVVAYVGPVVSAATGVSGAAVGLFQACVGVGSLVGVPLGGLLVDRGRGRVTQLVVFALMVVILAAYAGLLAGFVRGFAPAALAFLSFSGAAALFALIPVTQARLVGSAPESAPTLLGLNSSIMFLGQGAGAVAGGLAMDHLGFASIGLVGAAAALVGLVLTIAGGRLPSSSAAA